MYLSLKKDDVLLLCRMVRLLGCLSLLNEQGVIKEVKNNYRKAEGEYGSALPMVYVACKKAEMNHAVHAILYGMDDPLLSSSAIPEAAGLRIDYACMKVEKMYKFVMSMFRGEETMKSEKIRMLWNPLFNYAVDKLDQRDHDSYLGRYSSTEELLMEYIER